MGNKVTRDFKEMKLGQGHLTASSASRKALVPDAVVLDQAMSISVQRDPKDRSLHFYNNFKPLFTTRFTSKKTSSSNNSNTTESIGIGSSITFDDAGQVLFVIKAPSKGCRIVFKPSDQYQHQQQQQQQQHRDDSVIVDSSSCAGSINEEDLIPVAKVEIDVVTAANPTAFLSVKYRKPPPSDRSKRNLGAAATGGDNGSIASGLRSVGSASAATHGTGTGTGIISLEDDSCPFLDVYKAVKIPSIKFGAVVVDMQGQVVGKAEHGSKEQHANVQVAPGADASAVLALACIVNGVM